MRVVFDSFQSYIMDSIQPQSLHQQLANQNESPNSNIALLPAPNGLHHHSDIQNGIHNDPQNNLNALLTAINATPGMPPAADQMGINSKNPNSTAPMSIQSLLAGGAAEQQQQQSGWSHAEQYIPSSQSKRKYEGSDEDGRSKVRRTVRDHLAMDHNRVLSMTTVVCLHAAVAQKSYGSEKRFLCPPPIVRIEGPNQHMATQQLSMCIVSEDGVRSAPQKAAADNTMQAAFKHLHVAGTAKQKNFHLALDIATPAVPPSDGDQGVSSRTWASFESAPVVIISKPSKKTAKTRNIGSCILPGGPVSLFNRINSQTVRTKYMTIDHASLCASNSSWSAFNVNVIHRPPEPSHGMTGPQPVTYGSQIVLTDALSNISTSALIIRKVDKGRVSLDDGGPVSQMQKIALQRVNSDGSRQYLSAAGPLTATGAVAPPPSSGPGSQQGGTHTLMFQSPRIRDEVKDGIRQIIDEVDDYLCWTIVGISKFQYTFFDALGKNAGTPTIPLTPFPTLFTPPVYRPNTATLELTVSNFYSHAADGKTMQPLEVWLGSIGPLNQRVFQATLPGPLTSVTAFGHNNPGSPPSAVRSNSGVGSGESPGAGSNMSPGPSHADREAHSPTGSPHSTPTPPRTSGALGPLHSIVVLDMPPVDQVVRAIQDMLEPIATQPPVSRVREQQPKDRPQSSKSNERRNAERVSSPQDAQSSKSPSTSSHPHTQLDSPTVPTTSISGRSLPLLFIRQADGMGYHSGRSIVCENLIQNLTMNALNGPGGNVEAGWITAAQAAVSQENYAAAWSLRVM